MCNYRKIILIVSLFIALQASAQQSSVSTFSPYTFYGIGRLMSISTTAQRAKGGVGVADYSSVEINPRNSASYGRVARNTMLLDMGVCLGNFYQKSGNFRKTNNTVNIANVSLVAPLMKNCGIGFDLEPSSSVGYRVKFEGDVDDEMQSGQVVYDYQGEGGVTRWALGFGWNVAEQLSIGVEMILYNCSITNSYSVYNSSLSGGEADNRLRVERNYTYAKLLVGASVQWCVFESESRRFVLGAKFEPEANCRFQTQQMIVAAKDTLSNTTDNQRLKLPSRWTVGLAWRTKRWAVAADWELQRWSRSFTNERADNAEISWANCSTLALGGEFTPKPNDVRNFWHRATYRVGLRYDGGYLVDSGRRLKTRTLCLGLRLPLKQNSSINVAVEYGREGYDAEEVIMTDFLGMSIGLSFFGTDDWFKRNKYK